MNKKYYQQNTIQIVKSKKIPKTRNVIKPTKRITDLLKMKLINTLMQMDIFHGLQRKEST